MTIHNLMDLSVLKKAERSEDIQVQDSDTPNIINVARFHPQKAVDRLLRASHAAIEAGCPHTLYLVGGGEMETELRNLAAELHMDNVVFMGYRQNPYADIRKCDLFVLSSLYEGFATVNSESLIVGTPVLTTDVSGCEEQITSPAYGWIVKNDQQALTEGLIKALRDPQRLKEMKDGLRSYRYDNHAVLQKFMDAFAYEEK